MIGGENAHHDARGAEAALRTVMIDHRLLHGMQRAALGKVLDSDELGAVELAQEDDTDVDRLMHELAAFQPRQHRSARAAIAFGAPFLGPRGGLLFAQPVQHGRTRREPVERDLPATKSKTQLPTDLSLQDHRRSSQLLATWSFCGNETGGRATRPIVGLLYGWRRATRRRSALYGRSQQNTSRLADRFRSSSKSLPYRISRYWSR